MKVNVNSEVNALEKRGPFKSLRPYPPMNPSVDLNIIRRPSSLCPHITNANQDRFMN